LVISDAEEAEEDEKEAEKREEDEKEALTKSAGGRGRSWQL